MNFFLLFLLINFCYFTNGEKATVEQCDTAMGYRVDNSCMCKTEYTKCLISLISEGKCTKKGFPTKLIEKPCSNVHSKCSLTKNECEIGICGCFDTAVDCFIQNKCEYKKSNGSSTSVKRVRASDTIFGFNNLYDANFEKIE
ncbi:unnamed protein product [Meloidogyne enterolobii]|uniref:Uncharacterized protein n=2 Tax=Meloidogyne enterolobii TaxID=390850 RepID=A0A6V7XG62_MELEN|nr:unnamed protein product [Meloidogyne enterolobii]